jgi:hypothetical protein
MGSDRRSIADALSSDMVRYPLIREHGREGATVDRQIE